MGKTTASNELGGSGLLRRVIEHLHDDRGAAAVPFLLCLPIFLTVVAVIVQFALLVNAKIVVEHAAHMAGRAAMTSLPDAMPDNVQRAAQLVLTPLSPQASTDDAQADAMRDALVGTGVVVPQSFSQRYTYAMAATTVEYPDIDYTTSATHEMTFGVRYQFMLTVPVAMAVLAPNTTTVAGVTGRFYPMHSTCTVQTSSARASNTGSNGWPG